MQALRTLGVIAGTFAFLAVAAFALMSLVFWWGLLPW